MLLVIVAVTVIIVWKRKQSGSVDKDQTRNPSSIKAQALYYEDNFESHTKGVYVLSNMKCHCLHLTCKNTYFFSLENL